MKKLIFYGFPTVLLVLVLFYIGSFLVQINRVSTPPISMQKEHVEVNKTQRVQKDWRLALESSKSSDDYYYPVQEIAITLNMHTPVVQKHKSSVRHYKLITQPLDDYQFFCLTQVLQNVDVTHKIERYQNETGVVLYTTQKKPLQDIIEALKAYNITSSIKQIKGKK